jgi:hypothetical protein
MQAEQPGLRPPVPTPEAVQALDEFLRFRHVVRNIYSFQLDPERVARLIEQMRPAFRLVQQPLQVFVTFLKRVGNAG